jgi:hypothetical protein
MVRIALALLVLAGGCDTYRQRVKMDVFVCNPNSRTADADCGEGFVCYAAAQSVGNSVCVPSCDPARPETCPKGSCTVGGECLPHCSVEDTHACSAGGSVRSCVRKDYSPSPDPATDGVCLPVAFSCSDKAACESPVFNVCSNTTNGEQYSPTLLRDGAFCAQGNCQSMGVGCEPGSACIKEVLPPALAGVAPDVCVPNCLSRKRAADGAVVDECMVGFTCLSAAFPQQGETARVCLPGFAGWLCADDLGCGSGLCGKWDVTGSGEPLRHCTAPCQTDDDCVPFQGGIATHVEPNAFNNFTCKEGECRSFASLFFTAACVDPKAPCALDSEAKCVVNPLNNTTPSPGACPSLSMAAIANSSPAICQRACTGDGDCATLTQNTHVKYACVSELGICIASVPYLTPCTDDASCTPGLTCQPAMAPDGPQFPICTLGCQTTKDCTDNPTLGGAFLCAFGQCTPRTQSGCTPTVPSSDGCLSGILSSGVCVSPRGWFCDSDSRCQSGHCANDHCT